MRIDIIKQCVEQITNLFSFLQAPFPGIWSQCSRVFLKRKSIFKWFIVAVSVYSFNVGSFVIIGGVVQSFQLFLMMFLLLLWLSFVWDFCEETWNEDVKIVAVSSATPTGKQTEKPSAVFPVPAPQTELETPKTTRRPRKLKLSSPASSASSAEI